MNVFAKYDFKVPDDQMRLNIRVACNSDKALTNFMRLKIKEKSASIVSDVSNRIFNNMNVQNLSLPKNESGYIFIVEGNMPYNTVEG